jgi:hypothetical protein
MMYSKREKLIEIVNSEKMDIELAINILINSVGNNYDKFSKIDKWLIGRSLKTFQWYYDNEKDIVIKFDKKSKSSDCDDISNRTTE